MISQKELQRVTGLVFVDRAVGEEYGRIRPMPSARRHPAAGAHWTAFAEDDCGNAFLVAPDGGVAFWDHETDAVTALAPDWAGFVNGCASASEVDLDPGQVKSVWMDPAFAKELGLDVPPDGWKKGGP